MGLRINTNVASLNARRNLGKTRFELSRTLEKLSSGERINRAGDDAAGLAISERMKAEVSGLTMAARNANDAISMLETVEGATREIHMAFQRMRELAVQAASGVASTTDKDYLQLEVRNLIHEVKAIGENTKFNDMQLLQGGTFTFFTDIDVAGTSITTVTAAMTLAKLNITTAVVSIGGGANAARIAEAVTAIDGALAIVDNRRAALGAVSNRFDHIIDNLQNVIMNTVSSQSRIVDADFSVETTNLTRNTVLQQAATSMLAQANAQKNSVLSLIQQ